MNVTNPQSAAMFYGAPRQLRIEIIANRVAKMHKSEAILPGIRAGIKGSKTDVE